MPSFKRALTARMSSQQLLRGGKDVVTLPFAFRCFNRVLSKQRLRLLHVCGQMAKRGLLTTPLR